MLKASLKQDCNHEGRKITTGGSLRNFHYLNFVTNVKQNE